MADFLAGALTLAFVIAGVFFLRFWRDVKDRLFLTFALAFGLFALNQLLLSMMELGDETRGFTYILRVLGYILLLWAIVEKNIFAARTRE